MGGVSKRKQPQENRGDEENGDDGGEGGEREGGWGGGEEEGELCDVEADGWQAGVEGHVTHRMEPEGMEGKGEESWLLITPQN